MSKETEAGMQRQLVWTIASVIGLSLCWASQAEALITFDFNGLAEGSTNQSIEDYMNGVLTGSDAVDVVGARGGKTYTGDGHVTGRIVQHDPIPPVHYRLERAHLGTSDGFDDTSDPLHAFGTFDSYITNKDNTDRIVMLFNMPIYEVSFDYEIFPNGDCPAFDNIGSSQCKPTDANWPDFKFRADDQEVFRTIGIIPGQSGTFASSSVSSTTGIGNTELAPQFLGTSGKYTFADGVTKLEFVDWPSRIGIDNLNICTDSNECLPPPPPPVIPEPSSIFLLGTGLAGLVGQRFRRKA
jgi:hypothetical protein